MRVKVILLPGDVKNPDVPAGSTVGQAIRAAGFSLAGNESIQLNSSESNVDALVSDGDSIVIAKGAKGNTVVESKTFVNNVDVARMSKHDLLQAAVAVKARIKELKEANEGFESAAIDQEIGSLTTELVKIKDLLDSEK